MAFAHKLLHQISSKSCNFLSTPHRLGLAIASTENFMMSSFLFRSHQTIETANIFQSITNFDRQMIDFPYRFEGIHYLYPQLLRQCHKHH